LHVKFVSQKTQGGGATLGFAGDGCSDVEKDLGLCLRLDWRYLWQIYIRSLSAFICGGVEKRPTVAALTGITCDENNVYV